MNPNQKSRVVFGEEMREKVTRGVDILNQAVSSTLGARSRSVGIDMGFMRKTVKDGVSVARAINLEDPTEQYGVAVARESALKTVDVVGDGTSISIILTHAFYHEMLNSIRSGVSPMALKNPLTEEVDRVIKQLDEMAIPVKTLEQKINIATISANGDRELGEIIATTLDKVGESGVVTAQESKDMQTSVEFQEGMQLEHGMYSQWFLTDPERGIAVYENAPVLITDKPINSISEFGPFLSKITPVVDKLVIIAPEISNEILELLLKNKLGVRLPNGAVSQFPSLFIKAPGVGNNQNDILQDLCALTGAKYVSMAAGHKFEDLTQEDLGEINKIVASKVSTVITTTEKGNKAVEERLALIESQLKDSDTTGYDHFKLKERRAKLTNGVAVIKIGGVIENEMLERKERADDALGATRAAITEGIVIGGEMSLVQIAENTDNKLMKNVLMAPFRKLVENAGYDPSQILADIRNTKDKDFGFDVTDGQVKMLIKEGIIDPVLAPKTAIRNALSAALSLVEMGCVITLVEEKK